MGVDTALPQGYVALAMNETTKLLPAPLYAVSDEWEHNGHDDSDFYRVVFDPNTGNLSRVMTWTTRCGCVHQDGVRPFELKAPESVLRSAEKALADLIFFFLRAAEDRNTLKPYPVKFGDRLRTTRAIRGKNACPEGTVGEVFWTGTYGTFYRNGYNRPGRSNTRVGLRLPDGTRKFVSLDACRLDREPASDEAIRGKAAAIASKRNFYAAFATSSVSLV